MLDSLVSYVASIDTKQWLLFALFPAFLLVAALEAWHFRGRAIYKLQDSAASMVLGGSYLVAELALYVLFVWNVFDWCYQFRITTIEITPVSFLALYLAVEFCFWIYHFTSHKVRFFWATHCVHHASEKMNFTTAMRQSTLYPLAAIWAFFLPLTFLGFEREWIFFALAVNLAYQFFLHTQWIEKLPAPIEFIFNTPSHHRAHHGRNEPYIDKNFGGTLIIFDRVFGTFQAEDPDNKPEYGIIRQVYSYNPVTLTFHEWKDMFRDVLQPGRLSQRLKHLWADPYWTRGETCPRPNRASVSD